MDHVPATAPVRIARPSHDLAAAETFWVDGVGLEVLYRTEGPAQDDSPLLMVGPKDAPWHLELVGDAVAAEASNPGPEDLLVVYLSEKPDEEWIRRIVSSGGVLVAAANPYWDTWGTTVRDPDGYLLVLSHRTWD